MEKVRQAKGRALYPFLKQAIDRISMVLFVVAGGLVFLMTVFVCYDVFMRRVFGRPVPSGDEISGYLLVALTFLGLAYTLREGRHIEIDVVTQLMSAKTKRWASIITSILGLVTAVVLAWKAIELVESSYRYKVATWSVLGTQLWIPQMFVAVGFAAFCLQMASHVISVLRTPQERGESDG